MDTVYCIIHNCMFYMKLTENSMWTFIFLNEIKLKSGLNETKICNFNKHINDPFAILNVSH